MEDDEVAECVGEEHGKADEEEEDMGKRREGGSGGRDGEEGRDAGCFAYKSVCLIFCLLVEKRGKRLAYLCRETGCISPS